MKRREFRKATKLASWERCGGKCEGCGARLFPGHYEYHHDKEDTFGGEPALENCKVLCDNCHGTVTSTRSPVIAKSSRVRNRHVGIKKRRGRTIPGRKFDGTPIPSRWRA